MPLQSLTSLASWVVQWVKNFPAMLETQVRSLGREEGHGNPLQYSCLGNAMGRGAWRATVHGAAKSRTRLSDLAHRTVNNYFCLFSYLWYEEVT